MATTEPFCPECGTKMVPLWGAKFFCKNDCDDPQVLQARKAKEAADTQPIPTQQTWSGGFYGWAPTTRAIGISPSAHPCPTCSRPGVKFGSMSVAGKATQTWYACNHCNLTWNETN